MLSIDLFRSPFERRLHEGAVDDAEAKRLEELGRRIYEYKKELKDARSDAERDDIKLKIKKADDERKDILTMRMNEADRPQQPVKGQDIITPQQRLAKTQPQQPGVKAAVKDVVGGIKRFVKGEPDQGPTYEEQELNEYGPVGSKALGNANFTLLQRAISNPGIQELKLEFGNDVVRLTRDEMISLVKHYNRGPTRYDQLDFIEYVMSDPDKLIKLKERLKVTDKENQPRPEFELRPPGEPQGLLEKTTAKKKVTEPTQDQVQNLQVQRYLTRVRRQHPAAASDIEAIAHDELETRRKTQTAFDALKAKLNAQEKQLRQTQDINQQQSDELADLASRVGQAPAAEPAKAPQVQPMPVAPAAVPTATAVAPKVAAAPAPAAAPVPEPIPVPAPAPAKKAKKAKAKPRVKAKDKEPTVKKKPALSIPAGDVDRPRLEKPAPRDQRWSQVLQKIISQEPDAKDLEIIDLPDITAEPMKKAQAELQIEHGGGIGPRQRWQDLMKNEGWSDQGNPTPYAVYIDGRQWKEFRSDEQARAVADKLRANLQRQGRNQKVTIAPSQAWLKGKIEETIDEGIKDKAAAAALAACMAAGGTLQGCATNPTVGGTIGTVRDVGTAVKTAKNMTRAGVQDELNQELRNFIRAQGGDPGSQNLSTLYKLQKRMTQPKDQPNESASYSTFIRKYFPDIESEKDVEVVRQAINAVLADRRLNREQKDRTLQYLVALSLKHRLKLGREYYPVVQKYMAENKEPQTEKDFRRAHDSLNNQLRLERNPAMRQILRLDLGKLEALGKSRGWFKGTEKKSVIKEIKDTPAVERAILTRFMTDAKLRKIALDRGIDKVATAAEDVAYNVGDAGAFGSSDVSGWVKQVLQILGEPA